MEKTAIEKMAELSEIKSKCEQEIAKLRNEAVEEANSKINDLVEQLAVLHKDFPDVVSASVARFKKLEPFALPPAQMPQSQQRLTNPANVNFAKRYEIYNPDDKSVVQKAYQKYPNLALTKGKKYQILEEKPAGESVMAGMVYLIADDNNRQVRVSDKLFNPTAQVDVNKNMVDLHWDGMINSEVPNLRGR